MHTAHLFLEARTAPGGGVPGPGGYLVRRGAWLEGVSAPVGRVPGPGVVSARGGGGLCLVMGGPSNYS